MPPIVLKIEGNESFLPFSNLDQDELSKTWRVCTKVKDSLENGSRLENLSWRLWFIQNVLVSNDVKSKSKFQSWSSKTTRKMEREKPLESTSTLYPSNSNPGNHTSYATKTQKLQPLEDPKSVLDYSLDEIKPLGTENFVLHQFTSDQQDDQIIELKDIFPFGMGDFMDTTQNHTSAPEIEAYNHAPQSWPPAPHQNTTYYNNSMANLESNMQYLPTMNPVNPQYISQNNNPKQNSGAFTQHDFASNPISGVHSLFADYLDLPSMTIPTNSNESMTTIQQQSDLIVDYNNAAYVAAAAAATAVALNTLPNATLHNKLLATLPRHTLASAERLLTPVKRRASAVSKTQQQQQQRKRMVESLPQSTMEPPEKILKKQKNQQHYYGTFQVNANNTSPPITTAAAHTSTIVHDYSKTSQQNASTEEKAPQCSNCDATSTPLWRRSVDDKVLCNACGLYLKLHNAPRPKNLKPAHKSKEFRLFGGEEDGDNLTSDAEEAGRAQLLIKCTNCGTNKTPLWRRDVAGQPLCNACGLYYKLHNESRPLSMKTDVIKKRQRAESLNTNTTDAADDQSKKNRYFDQQVESGATLGYRQSASSLPGTGILMMTPNTSP